MKNKIIAIQGDNLKKLNYKNDTTIFLAIEAQKLGSKVFYYEPQNIFIKKNQIYAEGNFIKLYNKKKFFKSLSKKIINLENSNYLLVRQDPPFNMNYITTTYFLDRLKTVKIINNPTAIRNISEKLFSHEFKKYMPPYIFTSRISDIREFLKNELNETPLSGDFISISGEFLGKHKGIPFYTIGQRRGLELNDATPYYVIKIDKEQNRIVLGKEDDLYSKTISVSSVNWVSISVPETPISASVKLRSAHNGATATLNPLTGNKVLLELKNPERAVTPGQAAVFYQDDILLGGGKIDYSN